MLPFFMRKSTQKHNPEKHEKYPKKGQMAIRRVLVLIQVGGCADRAAVAARHPRRCAPRAPRQAHARGRATQPKSTKTKRRRAGLAAEPLGVRPAHTVALIFVFISSSMACPSPPYLSLSLSGVCAFSCVSISRLPYMMRITVNRFSSFSAI